MFKLGPGHINWSLVVGTVIVICVGIMAFVGPQLAPHDPLEEIRIIQAGDVWVTPPFPAFQVPGYPLGSDLFGRDLLSRLLYGIRPTLVMVLLVSCTRLIMGIMIGLLSGWYENRTGRWLTAMTSLALTVPVLIVALVAIAAVGVEFGIWAFIVGLCITGWAETAQVIREKARAVKREQFIEAGQAVGATHMQILFGHVLRHVMPMVWMLLAFEISNTLMATASLGFLGYFIGGDVWIEVSDFVARRVSGEPELGQMLATSGSNILEPWGMFAVGTVIFITVLGFNLMGEGMRRRLAYERDAKQTIYGYILSQILPDIRLKITKPVSLWAHSHPLLTVSACILCIALVPPFILWRIQVASGEKIVVNMPDHIWASEWHDPYGSLQTSLIGPSDPEVVWKFETSGQIKGGIVVNSEGLLYLGDSTGILYAIEQNGTLIWEYKIPRAIIGLPALDAAGSLYFSDDEASLYALSPQGELRWQYTPETQRVPASGPVVGFDGTIYSGYGSNVMALDSKGNLLWTIAVPYGQYKNPPRLSADGQLLFYDALIIDSATGELFSWSGMQDMDFVLTGLDGRLYARSKNLMMAWKYAGSDSAVVQSAMWDSSAFTFVNPRYTGVNADGMIWMVYTSQGYAAVVWMDMQGNVINLARTDRIQRALFVGMDGNDTAYVCGNTPSETATCYGLVRDQADPLWSFEVEPGEQHQLEGGALDSGRLYLALAEGRIIALGDP